MPAARVPGPCRSGSQAKQRHQKPNHPSRPRAPARPPWGKARPARSLVAKVRCHPAAAANVWTESLFSSAACLLSLILYPRSFDARLSLASPWLNQYTDQSLRPSTLLTYMTSTNTRHPMRDAHFLSVLYLLTRLYYITRCKEYEMQGVQNWRYLSTQKYPVPKFRLLCLWGLKQSSHRPGCPDV
ncbi:hypothetical protein BU16DRAFT_585716, partial [Lophium mytilinum]